MTSKRKARRGGGQGNPPSGSAASGQKTPHNREMHPVYRENAFRILGLSADADLQEIQTAGQHMALQTRSGPVAPPSPVETGLPLIRVGREDVAMALYRMASPLDRLVDRLFWFAPAPPRDGSPPEEWLGEPLPVREEALCMTPETLLYSARRALAEVFYKGDPLWAPVDEWQDALTYWAAVFNTGAWRWAVRQGEPAFGAAWEEMPDSFDRHAHQVLYGYLVDALVASNQRGEWQEVLNRRALMVDFGEGVLWEQAADRLLDSLVEASRRHLRIVRRTAGREHLLHTLAELRAAMASLGGGEHAATASLRRESADILRRVARERAAQEDIVSARSNIQEAWLLVEGTKAEETFRRDYEELLQPYRRPLHRPPLHETLRSSTYKQFVRAMSPRPAMPRHPSSGPPPAPLPESEDQDFPQNLSDQEHFLRVLYREEPHQCRAALAELSGLRLYVDAPSERVAVLLAWEADRLALADGGSDEEQAVQQTLHWIALQNIYALALRRPPPPPRRRWRDFFRRQGGEDPVLSAIVAPLQRAGWDVRGNLLRWLRVVHLIHQTVPQVKAWEPAHALDARVEPILEATGMFIRDRHGGASDDLGRGYTGSARSEYYRLKAFCRTAPGLSWRSRRQQVNAALSGIATRHMYWPGNNGIPVEDSGTGYQHEPGYAERMAMATVCVPPVLREN